MRGEHQTRTTPSGPRYGLEAAPSRLKFFMVAMTNGPESCDERTTPAIPRVGLRWPTCADNYPMHVRGAETARCRGERSIPEPVRRNRLRRGQRSERSGPQPTSVRAALSMRPLD